MTTHPTAAELLEAVSGFIETRAAPQLTGRDAFLARVAVNALAVVKRELELGPAAEAAAAERLEALLGDDGPLEALNDELCARLASGELDLSSPGVLEHLKASTIDQVRIDQPNYSGLKAVEGEKR
jgi:hypothetical protein